MKTIKLNSKVAAAAIVMALLFGTPFLDNSNAQRPDPPHGGGRGAAGPPVQHGGGGAPRMQAPRGVPPRFQAPPVERRFHGSVGRPNVGVVHPEFNRGFHGGGFDRNFHRNFDVEVNHGFGHFFHGPRIGAFVPILPFGFSTFYYGGAPYYYDDGTYYQQGPGGYQVVNPPVGATIGQPPEGSYPVTVGGQTYYYVDGTFYVAQGDGYAIVGAPLGAMVPELPSGAAQTMINGIVYYVYNNVYYQPVMENGVTMYVTVAPQ